MDKMKSQSKKSCFRLVFISIFLIAMLQGCAAKKSDIPDSRAKEDQVGAERFKESQRVFALRNPIMASNIGDLELIVRMATIAEIPEDLYKIWAVFPAQGAGSLALGLVAPPLYASALVVGGVFLIPLGTYGYLHDKKVWDSINGALANAEFTRAVDRAMKERLNGAFTRENAPDLKIEIIIQGFGLMKSSAMNQHCFAVSAEFIVSQDTSEIKRDNLNITYTHRSKDAPPPQCAGLENFAENDAMLVKDTLAEYSEVLAVMAMDRFLREHAK